ncbi:nitrate reductase subunit beta [Geomonas limicola]|uniref:Nitrate reductase subunit beta n=1 Tax=Geomonas limicola TaxID=2740186 RepID=A0A6V8N2I2_9BACT|nr:nitrate reductase subunit beta [Geomonas limicola]GFO66696.1 nitrate reductase subunit beta [Geomonas limicola]
MDVRAQIVMAFHLDKCIGCHTCSLACKNIWSDRRGTEYMWWNNVETRPGVGYPKRWEDQERFRGGWKIDGKKVTLKSMPKGRTLANLFFQPNLPRIEDYYEPFDFDYGNLAGAPEGNDQPVAGALSQVSGEPIEQIKGSANWDDDLGGSTLYAEWDPNLPNRELVQKFDTIFMQYLPRICNHCLHPSCVASCPSRALYKRGEDGVVLVDQNTCRGWRFCVSACPYKKVYFNWKSGKAEKCIFCYPRVETGQVNACAQSCVGRIRFVGVVLYDADLVEAALLKKDAELVEAMRGLIMDPHDPQVQQSAARNGVSMQWLDAAKNSPIYALVKKFRVALPLHPEFRTLPMTWYIPSLAPVLSVLGDTHRLLDQGIIPKVENLRVPVQYLARLLAGGNGAVVEEVMQKLLALRTFMRGENLGKPADPEVLSRAGLDREAALQLYRLFTTAGFNERNVIPPQQREDQAPELRRKEAGFGILTRVKSERTDLTQRGGKDD